MRIDTDTEDMLSASLPFRQNAIAIDAAFPSLDGRMLVVVEAPDADRADAMARVLVEKFRADADVFQDVSSSVADPFLDKHGLLYLSREDLTELAERLAAAQPFLGTLWQQPNLAGLERMMALLAKADTDNPASLSEAARVLERMADTADGSKGPLSWSGILMPGDAASLVPVRRLISVKPVLDYTTLHPAGRAKAVVAKIAADATRYDGVSVRITGGTALEDEELRSVEDGMAAAGIVSLIAVSLILILGLRSLGAITALLATLIAGLIFTAAFAIFALGALNLISVAFAVLFVGLSVDFGIHVYLRSLEAARQRAWRMALVDGARAVAPSLTLCAVTSAIAFFSFLPTAYVGLAELGLIAGVGMMVALVVNLTLLPALLALLVRRPPTLRGMASPTHSVSARRAGIVVVGVFGVSAVCLWLASGARFDFDPMNLRSPDGPAMQTFADLSEAGLISPYDAEILTTNGDEARALAAKLASLPTVESVRTVDDLIPKDQDEKLYVIEDLALFVGPAFYAPEGGVRMTDAALLKAADGLRENLLAVAGLPTLGAAAEKLLARLNDAKTPSALAALNETWFVMLPVQLLRLATLLEAGPVTRGDLPRVLTQRFVAEDGRNRIEVTPQGDARDPAQLEAFVSAITQIAPHATGAPVIIVEAGRAVLAAFAQALAIAIVLIAVVIFAVVRNVVSVLLVFAPVVVAAIWTLAAASVFEIPFNFANVIVLPLLFGLSVDFGVHLVMRARTETGDDALMSTSTPRAVLLSALTTIASFGAIVLSGHPGTASMGLLLTISVSLTLVAILVFLPALMAVLPRARKGVR